MNDLCDRFTQEVIPRKRPLTQRDYRRHIAVAIRPALGRMKVAAVVYADVDAGTARSARERRPKPTGCSPC